MAIRTAEEFTTQCGRGSADVSLKRTRLCDLLEDLYRDLPPAAAAKSLQSCPTLCDPIDSSPPGSSIPGIVQGGTLEWVAISFSSA